MIKSTDFNVNGLDRNWIDVLRTVDSFKQLNITKVSSEEYNLLRVHDPYLVYYLYDTDEFYLGDLKVSANVLGKVGHYFMGISMDKLHKMLYIVYQYNIGGVLPGTARHGDHLVPILVFNEAEDAIRALEVYETFRRGDINLIKYSRILLEYTYRECTITDCISALIATGGYKDDPEFQRMLQIQNEYGNEKYFAPDDAHERYRIELNPIFRDHLLHYYNEHDIMFLYARIYDEIAKNNFFYRENESSLKLEDMISAAKRIYDIINNFTLINS